MPFSLPPIALIIAAVVVVLLLIFVITSIVRCSAPSEPEAQPATSEQVANPSENAASSASSASTNASAASSSSSESSSSASQDQAEEEPAEIDKSNDTQKELVTILGEDEATKLLTAAQKNKQTLWIAAHPDRYAFDGYEVQYKILKLAADEPAAVPFVREFPAQYPSKDVRNDESIAMDTHSPSENVPDTNVPHLYQWDRRWGNTVYSSAAFGLTGCGPTSLAMVYQGIKNTADKNPHDLAVIAEERGYMSQYEGTAGAFFTDMAGELGLNCEELYPTSDSITEALKAGKVVIANLGPGSFTEHGHFFVLTGLTSDGKVIINDPYSFERSSQTWDADTIANESITLYSYSAA